MPDTARPPIFWEGTTEEHIRKVALIVDELVTGKSNNGFTVTLAANATETVIDRARVSVDTRVSLVPTSASAAAAIGAGSVWVETTVGRITIHHDSQPDTDRTFDATAIG